VCVDFERESNSVQAAQLVASSGGLGLEWRMRIRLLFLLPLLILSSAVWADDEKTDKKNQTEKKEAAEKSAPVDGGAKEEKAKGEEKKDAKEKDGEWKPLFDGKTLKNWEVTKYIGSKGSEVIGVDAKGKQVKEGVKADHNVILINPGEPLGGIRWVGKELPKVDYEISLEARRVEGDDFFCCVTFPYKKDNASFVVGGWGGTMTGISSVNNYDASENTTTKVANFDNGTWYKIRMRLTGDRIEAWIDDEQMVNLTTTDKIINMRFGEIEESVPLGISVFQSTSEVRNIRLKTLKAGSKGISKKEDEY